MSIQSKQIEITSPCPITLDRSKISVGDRKMFCDHCTKDVHLLSEMSEVDARTFMREQEGNDICVSYRLADDGGIRFRDETFASIPPVEMIAKKRGSSIVPVSALARRAKRGRPAVTAAAVLGAMLLAACTSHSEPDSIVIRDTPITTTHTVIPDEVPCDSRDPQIITVDPTVPDDMVDGGMKAVPIHDSPDIAVAGGLRAAPVEPPPPPVQVRGRIASRG